MNSLITIRISKELKKKLEKLNIHYAKETRAYLADMVREKRLAKTLAKINASRRRLEKKIGKTSDSKNIIRSDRRRDTRYNSSYK